MLTAPPTTGEDAVAACNALGLFSGGGRLVVVEGVETLAGAPDVEASTRTSPTRRPARCSRSVAREAPKSEALASLAGQARAGAVPTRCPGRGAPPPGWRASSSGSASRSTPTRARALVEIVGDDVLMLASEIEKIATWAARPTGRRRRDRDASPCRPARSRRGPSPTRGARATCPRRWQPARRRSSSASRSRIAVALASHVGRVRAAQVAGRGGPRRARGREAPRPESEYPARKALPTRRTTRARSSTRRSSAWPSSTRRSRARAGWRRSSSSSARSPT